MFIRDYLEDMESKDGALKYWSVLKDFLLWLIGEKLIDKETISDIAIVDFNRIYPQHISKYLRQKENNGISPTTLETRKNIIRSFLSNVGFYKEATTMAKTQRKYDMEYKIQAVKLAKELGGAKAAAELGIPENTMYAWTKAAREGRLDIGSGSHTPQTAMTLAEDDNRGTENPDLEILYQLLEQQEDMLLQ